MNDITPYLFDKQSEIRSIIKDGEPWFVAKDVCDVLGIANSRQAVEPLDDDEKGVCLTYTLGGTQELNTINESGLYMLLFRSRKAMTPGTVQHRFRKWVTSEVLPSIRKTGKYGHDMTLGDDESIPIQSPQFPGYRFAEERKRLGYATRKEFAQATSLKTSQIAQYEDLGKMSKNMTVFLLLMDAGFDIRYWQTGNRSPFRPVNPDEAALIRTYRQLPEDQRTPALISMQHLALPKE